MSGNVSAKGKAKGKPSGAADAIDGWKPRFNPWLIAIAVTLAAFMEILDTTIVNVALPHIAGTLAASSDEATYALTSYLVANGIVLTVFGLDLRHDRTQALLHHLPRHVHGLLVPLRHLAEPRPAHHLPADAGVLRRWFAAKPAGDHPRHLPGVEARRGVRLDGGRDHRRPGPGADLGRLHHGHLFLALDLLGQRPRRHFRRRHQHDPRRGSAVGEGQAETPDQRHRLHRPFPHRTRPRMFPGGDGQGRGLGLVRILLHPCPLAPGLPRHLRRDRMAAHRPKSRSSTWTSSRTRISRQAASS